MTDPWRGQKSIPNFATLQPCAIDGERNSGKYFWSADIADEKSPTLQVTWAD